jgi:hypothetical protein
MQCRELRQGGKRGKPMSVSNRFVIGLVKLGEQHNQMHGAEYYKPKTQIQTSNKMQPRGT